MTVFCKEEYGQNRERVGVGETFLRALAQKKVEQSHEKTADGKDSRKGFGKKQRNHGGDGDRSKGIL